MSTPQFIPPNVTLRQVHEAVPKDLFQRHTGKSLFYVLRHLAIMFGLYFYATRISDIAQWSLYILHFEDPTSRPHASIRLILWLVYWGWQSLVFAGVWCLGHEAGHDTLSPLPAVNALIGILLHTFILVPFYAWKSTHRAHHKAANHLDRDETYIPATREELKLPPADVARLTDYADILEEAPLITLCQLFVRQFVGWPIYLFDNRKGDPKYRTQFTSHYLPSSKLFKKSQRRSIIYSDIFIAIMLGCLYAYARCTSWSSLWAFYLIPWLLANNWIITFTYLQHTTPLTPWYREDAWTFARGALATVDRPFFGWIGVFLLHNIAHTHVAHHFFSTIPFYNQPMVTEAIKPVLGEYYTYDSSNVFVALWKSFTECIFIESEGDVVFYKNRKGKAAVNPSGSVVHKKHES